MESIMKNYPVSFDKTGAIAGLLSILCYFGAAVLPLPGPMSHLLGFAFGPLIIVSYMGIYSYFGRHKLTPALHVSYLFGIITGIMVTALIFIQVANNMWHQESMAAADSDEMKQLLKASYRGANRVQAALDVAFDVFVTVSVILLGYCMLSYSLFVKILGSIGILLSALLLGLNLYTFPTAPAESGLFDAGPFLGLWMLTFFIWLTVTVFRKKDAAS